jgi:sigma-E factor negative regulatory protein RseA
MTENLSAWMDGELGNQQARQLPQQLTRDERLRRNWDYYHLIGDALRGVQGPDLYTKICARLDAEPTVLAPQRPGAADRLRWIALSMAASIAAVALVGWMALSGVQQDTAQIAAAPVAKVTTTVAEAKQVAVPAGQVANDYLLAHQRYSPSNAMQGVAPYVRTVSEERSAVR